MKTRVAIARGDQVYARTQECLRLLGDGLDGSIEDAFIKFNTAPYHLLGTTEAAGHPDTVRAVAHYLRGLGARTLVAGDGPSAPDAGAGFRACGYTRMCEEEGIQLADLDAAQGEELAIPEALSLHRVRIATSARARKTLVSVAWLRTHGYTTISLCMKNLMGLIVPPSQRGTMHEPFPERITDLVGVVRPHLCVIDGTTALDEGVSRTPIQFGLTVAGWDPVAVDAVGTAVMGFEPMQITHIWLADQRGLGTADLDGIDVVGVPIEDVVRRFAPLGQGMRTTV